MSWSFQGKVPHWWSLEVNKSINKYEARGAIHKTTYELTDRSVHLILILNETIS